jgi:MerR family mercuric resistance operon transcriptional regulator
MVQSQASSDFTIAKLAKAGLVGVETIRYYQRRGLLRRPARAEPGLNGGAIRRYDDGDVRALRFIRSAQAAGFTLDEIAELIKLNERDDRPRARELARERITALNAQIAGLEAARDALMRLERECSAKTIGPCPIFTAFEPK